MAHNRPMNFDHTDERLVRRLCDRHKNKPDALLEILHEVQVEHGFLTKNALVEIADALNISRADIYGVVSFYEDFKTEPEMWPKLKICRGEACQAVGGEELAKYAEENLAEFAGVEDVYCLGNCALGPAVLMAEELFGKVTPEKLHEMLGHRIMRSIEFDD